jgi:transposase
LYWDHDGYAIWYKRLEAGCFHFPLSPGQSHRVTVTAAELTMLLDGVDLASVRRRKRYRRPA